MGYTTEFEGSVTVTPALNEQEVDFINRFSDSRRMLRTNGPYYIGGGDFGQARENDIIDYNRPPEGQPGLWCQWVASEDGTEKHWNGAEKFYYSAEWMQYLIAHFIGSDPKAKYAEPDNFQFLQGHTCAGTIRAQGEESDDCWELEVKNNVVEVYTLEKVRSKRR